MIIFLIIIILLLNVKYSTPLRVDEITDIKEVIACYKELLSLFNILVTISKFPFYSILKISFLINSYTKFFHNSGAICNALTHKDNNTSTKLSVLFSLKCFSNFYLCSYITVSVIKSFPSNLPSFITILWYFPNYIL